MAKKAETGTYHGPRSGPPGDDTVYLMPRDFAAWEKAWGVHMEALDVTRGGQSQVELDMSPEAVAERAEKKRRHAEAIAYVAGYTGTWGLPLDIIARRDWGTAKLRLSEAQVDALLKGRDRDQRIEQARINTELWQDEEYQRHVSQRTATPQDAQLAAQPSPGSPMGSATAASPDDGWYMVDGEPWKVQWNLDHTGRYAKRLVPRDRRGDRDTGLDVGAKPKWEYVQGGLGIVARKGTRMTVEDAAQYGKLYGACAVCGRTLTFEGSIERGIGPICYGRITG